MALHHQYEDDEAENLIIHLDPKLRRRIRVAATQNNVSVQQYVEGLLEQTVPAEEQERRGLNPAAVESLLAYRDELKRAHPDVVFEDSTELLHQMREERMRELEQR